LKDLAWLLLPGLVVVEEQQEFQRQMVEEEPLLL
jgi:hypothetical protein